jgi:hypothetical protein
MSQLPDHETILRLVEEKTPVRIAFVGGERMFDLPTNSIIERVVFVKAWTELGGLVLVADQPAAPWTFWTDSEGGFHPRLTKIEIDCPACSYGGCVSKTYKASCLRCGGTEHVDLADEAQRRLERQRNRLLAEGTRS